MVKRTETIKFSEFMNNGYKHKADVKRKRNNAIMKVAINGAAVATAIKLAIPVAALVIPAVMLTKALPTMAATTPAVVEVSGHISDAVKTKIVHAFDPLVDLMVGLSVPIAGVMLTGGALMIMIGQREAGFKLIMNSCLGYVLVNLSPMFIDLLVGIGKAV